MQLSRRQFFKVAAGGLTGSSLVAMGFSPTAALAEVRTFKLARSTETRNTCPYCSVGCGIIMYSLGDKAKNAHAEIFHIEGDPDHPVNRGSLCPKGAGLLDFVHSKNRLKYPEVREPGTKEWKRISWDEAFTRIAKLVKEDRDANFIAKNADGVTVWFTDGSSASGDLLIAADGSHSALRPWVLGFTPQRRYAGYVNWNGLVEIDEALAPGDQWTTFVGEGKRVSLMPVSAGRFYFFFDVPLPAGLAEDRDTLRADLSRYFAGWAPPVQKLIAALDPQTTNRIEIHDIEPFSRLVRGRVALLGDAGHSTTPDIGQGGCAAMEDAVVLGAVFRQTRDIAAALREYEAQRCDRVRDLVLKARKRCDITHGKDMQLTEAWYQELREETGERIINGMCDTILSGPLG